MSISQALAGARQFAAEELKTAVPDVLVPGCMRRTRTMRVCMVVVSVI